MPLVLREEKGSKLTIAEMDGNLVYDSNDVTANLYKDANNLNFLIGSGVRAQGASVTTAIDFMGLGSPERFATMSFFNATMITNITGFSNADKLTSLEDQGTEPAINLSNCGLSAASIDSLFTQLPTTSVTATLNVSGNTGSGTCDPTIATAKGYTVTT